MISRPRSLLLLGVSTLLVMTSLACGNRVRVPLDDGMTCPEDSGYLVEPDGESATFGVGLRKCSDRWIIRFSRLTGRTPRGQAQWQLLDSAALRDVGPGETVWGGACERNGEVDPELVGVGVADEAHYPCAEISTPRVVYRTSARSGTIQREDARGVTCGTPCPVGDSTSP